MVNQKLSNAVKKKNVSKLAFSVFRVLLRPAKRNYKITRFRRMNAEIFIVRNYAPYSIPPLDFPVFNITIRRAQNNIQNYKGKILVIIYVCITYLLRHCTYISSGEL